MIDLETVTSFLGWCSILNIGLLFFYTAWLMLFRDFTKRTHSTMFGVDERTLDSIYFQYLAHYKLAVLVLNIVPYFALKIVG
ncbi:MAG: DUF6868 family protein [Pseudomonadota bacterium]